MRSGPVIWLSGAIRQTPTQPTIERTSAWARPSWFVMIVLGCRAVNSPRHGRRLRAPTNKYSGISAWPTNRGQKPAEALVAFRAYAAAHPTAAAYNQIGLVEAALSHIDEALDAFEQALKLDPNDSMAYAYRGVSSGSLCMTRRMARRICAAPWFSILRMKLR